MTTNSADRPDGTVLTRPGAGTPPISFPGLVSVIVPAFNPGPYLAEAVGSVLAQTVTEWELIVVDDGSTTFPDLAADDRIRVVRQPNSGPASARNLGIDLSKGEFLSFLDADDRWLPTKLARQLDVMTRRPELALCATQFRHFDSVGTEGAIGYGRPMSRSDLLATGDGICTSSVMVRSSALHGKYFRTDLVAAEDFDMWIRLSSDQLEGFVPTVEVLYRRHASNLTRDYEATWRGIQGVYASHPDPIGDSGLARYKSLFVRQAWDSARTAGIWKAGGHIRSAARISPRITARIILSAVIDKLRRKLIKERYA